MQQNQIVIFAIDFSHQYTVTQYIDSIAVSKYRNNKSKKTQAEIAATHFHCDSVSCTRRYANTHYYCLLSRVSLEGVRGLGECRRDQAWHWPPAVSPISDICPTTPAPHTHCPLEGETRRSQYVEVHRCQSVGCWGSRIAQTRSESETHSRHLVSEIMVFNSF